MTIEDKICYHRHILDEGNNQSKEYQEIIIEEYDCASCDGLNFGCDAYLTIGEDVRDRLICTKRQIIVCEEIHPNFFREGIKDA